MRVAPFLLLFAVTGLVAGCSPQPSQPAPTISRPTKPTLKPFEASDPEGHLVSRGFRVRRDDGNYLRAGEWTYYFPNGLVREQGAYVDDKKSGVWSYYDINTGYSKYLQSGEHYISHKERYENGESVYRWVYNYRPWIVGAEGGKRNGRNHGKWIEYSADGSKHSITLYDSGSVIGWTLFDESGGVFATFADGVYTLKGVRQQESAIPKKRNFETGQLSGYVLNALQHANDTQRAK